MIRTQARKHYDTHEIKPHLTPSLKSHIGMRSVGQHASYFTQVYQDTITGKTFTNSYPALEYIKDGRSVSCGDTMLLQENGSDANEGNYILNPGDKFLIVAVGDPIGDAIGYGDYANGGQGMCCVSVTSDGATGAQFYIADENAVFNQAVACTGSVLDNSHAIKAYGLWGTLTNGQSMYASNADSTSVGSAVVASVQTLTLNQFHTSGGATSLLQLYKFTTLPPADEIKKWLRMLQERINNDGYNSKGQYLPFAGY